jgi:hypothetical protein
VVCDTKLKARQTISQRAEEIRRAVTKLSSALASGQVKVAIGPQGAVAFVGWTDTERDGISDACAYRRLMVSGSALAKAAIARAEQVAGRSVDRQALAQRWHSHDAGATWSRHDHD